VIRVRHIWKGHDDDSFLQLKSLVVHKIGYYKIGKPPYHLTKEAWEKVMIEVTKTCIVLSLL
jgi:hypothetical protein